MGDNEGKRGLDFLNGITMGASFGNVLGKWGGKVELENNILTIEAKGVGQTSLSIRCEDGSTHYATITVRKGANDNGWL